MKRLHVQAVASAALAVLGPAAASRASVIAYEPLGYSVGTLPTSTASGNTDTGSSGFTNSPNNVWTAVANSGSASIVTGGLSAPDAPTYGGNTLQLLTGTANGNAETYFEPLAVTQATSSTAANGTSIFIGFLMKLPADGANSGNGGVQLQTMGNNDDIINIGYNSNAIGTAPTTSYGARWYTGKDGSLNSGTFTSDGLSDISVGTSAYIVMELDYKGGNGNDTMEMYVNPTSTSATPVFSITNASLPGLGAIQVSSGNNTAGSTPFIVDIGGITIGTTFSDVLAPEPATMSFFGALGIAALLHRRRRQTEPVAVASLEKTPSQGYEYVNDRRISRTGKAAGILPLPLVL